MCPCCSTPETIPRVMSSVSLQKQDSDASSSIRGEYLSFFFWTHSWATVKSITYDLHLYTYHNIQGSFWRFMEASNVFLSSKVQLLKWRVVVDTVMWWHDFLVRLNVIPQSKNMQIWWNFKSSTDVKGVRNLKMNSHWPIPHVYSRYTNQDPTWERNSLCDPEERSETGFWWVYPSR